MKNNDLLKQLADQSEKIEELSRRAATVEVSLLEKAEADKLAGFQAGKDSVTFGSLLKERMDSLMTAVAAGASSAYQAVAETAEAGLEMASNASQTVVSGATACRDSVVAMYDAGAQKGSDFVAQGQEALVTTWEKGDKEKAAIIVAGALVTVATGYGLYRAVTSKKAKKLYAWFTSSQDAEKQAA